MFHSKSVRWDIMPKVATSLYDTVHKTNEFNTLFVINNTPHDVLLAKPLVFFNTLWGSQYNEVIKALNAEIKNV